MGGAQLLAALQPLPFLLLSCGKLPGFVSAWLVPQLCQWPTVQLCWGPLRVSRGCDALREHRTTLPPCSSSAHPARSLVCTVCQAPGSPARPQMVEEAPTAQWLQCLGPCGLRACQRHSWVTLRPVLGGQPAMGWHGSGGRESAVSS